MQAALEGEAHSIDIAKHLPGKWKVLFTTALDVVSFSITRLRLLFVCVWYLWYV